MMRNPIRIAAALAVAGVLAIPSPATADDATAEELLQKIEAVELPAPDLSRRDDPEYVQTFIRERQEAMARRADLIGELFEASPDHPRVPDLMQERWAALIGLPDKAEALTAELEAIAGDESSPLRTDAAFFEAVVTMRSSRDADEVFEAIDAFIALAPEDDRGAQLLFQAAEYALPGLSADRKAAVIQRIAADYPDSQVAQQVGGLMRQAKGEGEPFELAFQDAIDGESISVQEDLKGKVVVIDFWATWCGPCVAELPHMKELYAQYKDKGVEFIGVSLDQPDDDGLAALKTFVAENDLSWPQYHGGDASSNFARTWGITAIPTLFIVDTKGLLHSTNARGQLDTLIPELLEAKAGDASGGE